MHMVLKTLGLTNCPHTHTHTYGLVGLKMNMELKGRMGRGLLWFRSSRFFSVMGIVSLSILFTEEKNKCRVSLYTCKLLLDQHWPVASSNVNTLKKVAHKCEYKISEKLVTVT